MMLLVHNFQQAGNMQLVHKKKTDSDVRSTKFEHSILGHVTDYRLLCGNCSREARRKGARREG